MGVFHNIMLNCVSYILIVTIKEELLVLEIKVSGYYIRHITVTYRYGTSVVRNFKFLTPFFIFLIINLFNHHYNLLE
jgi:hypothetical protein